MKLCNLRKGKRLAESIKLCTGDVEIIRENGERTLFKQEDIASGKANLPEFGDYVYEIEFKFANPDDAGRVAGFVLGDNEGRNQR